MDGVLLDIEGGFPLNQPTRDALSYGICALRRALEAAIPGSLLTLSEASTPFGELNTRLSRPMRTCRLHHRHHSHIAATLAASGVHGISLPKYGLLDIQAVSQCVDFVQPGAYCTCTGGPPPTFTANGSALDTTGWGIPPGAVSHPLAVCWHALLFHAERQVEPRWECSR